jgi:hypothetical protein
MSKRMRNRLHEIIAGRTVSAWRRRTERSTAWLREFSVASSWLAARAPLDAAYWNASPFGARLAEVTAAGRHSSPSASTPRHSSAQSAPLQETARVRSRDMADYARAPMPVPRSRAGAAVAGHDLRSHHETSLRSGSARARSRDMPDPARAPMPVPRSRAGAGVAGHDRPAHRGVGERSSAMSRAQLTALAGRLPRALRSTSSPARDAGRLIRSLDATTDTGDGRKRVAMDAASSSAALVRRLAVRLDRAVTRSFGRPLSAAISRGGPVGAMGWNVGMAPPASNLVLAAPDVSNSVTPSSAVDPVGLPLQQDLHQPQKTSGMESAARSQGNAKDSSLASWRRPIAAPEPALTLFPPDAPVAITATAAPAPSAGVQPLRRETLPRSRHAVPFDASSSRQLPDAWPASRSGTQAGAGASVPPEVAAASAQNNRGGAPAPGAEPADMRPDPFQPFTVAHHPGARRAAAEASGIGAPWAATRSAFDQVEFAEFLRRALVDDARRYGIDV